MCTADGTVCLGFTSTRYPKGVHVCHLYSSEKERDEVLGRFLAAGLAEGERAACFSDEHAPETLGDLMARLGVDVADMLARGQLSLDGAAERYFANGVFDPEMMLGALRAFHEHGEAEGYPAVRVIGEMSPQVQTTRGADRLAEYECRVNQVVATHPVTAVCQYDTRRFSGETIMEILAVHPLMVRDGAVMENPFFIPPEDYLKRRQPPSATPHTRDA